MDAATVVIGRILLLGGWALAETYKHNYYVLMYVSSLSTIATSTSGDPFLLYGIIMLYAQSNQKTYTSQVGGLWWASHSPLYPTAWTYLRGILSPFISWSPARLQEVGYRGPRLGP